MKTGRNVLLAILCAVTMILIAGCTIELPKASSRCPADGYIYRCSADNALVQKCDGGAWSTITDCAANGLICDTADNPSSSPISCADKACKDPKGDAYYALGTQACYDIRTQVRCIEGGYWNFTDCSSQGQICRGGLCIEDASILPWDMDTCLDKNETYYWDQEAEMCYANFSSDIINISCSDPDGGIDTEIYAHTFGFRSDYADSRDQRIRTGGADACLSGKQIAEHYCDESGFIQTAYLDCSDTCNNSVCIQNMTVACKDTDMGNEYGAPGICSSQYLGDGITQGDYCVYYGGRAGVLKEAYCSPEGCQLEDYACPSDQICRSAKCRLGNTTEPICEDSDNGSVYVAGTLYSMDLIGAEDTCYISRSETNPDGSMTDSCYEGMLTTGEYCGVYEYHCADSDYSSTKFALCPNGCVEGACILNATSICTDPDGADYYTKGTSSGYDRPTGNYVTVTDNCEYDTVNEYVCDGMLYGQETEYACPNGCLDGACI